MLLVFEKLRNFLSELWSKIRRKGKRSVSYVYGKREAKEMPERAQEKIGELKAEVHSLKKELQEKEDKLAEKKKKEEEEKIREIEERREELRRKEVKKHTILGDYEHLDVVVMSKDHKPLGWLKYLTATPKGRIGVVVERNGALLKVWEMKNLEGLIHHSENFSSQIKTGVLILNRDWEGNFVPDIDVNVPAIPKEEVEKIQRGDENGGR